MIIRDFGMDTASLAGPLAAKLAAVRRAGFSQVMISASEVVGHPDGVDGGIRAVRDSGIAVTGLETLRDFEGLDGKLRDYKMDVAKSMLRLCRALGGRLLIVEASTSSHANTDADAIVRDLRALATLAIPLGVRIAFKGVSWSRTASNFASAGELVLRADCRNLGLAIDAFDILTAQIPLDDLDAIGPEQMFVVQLSDFQWQTLHPTADNAATKTRYRVFPGEGAHGEELAAFVGKVDALGYAGTYSFDVYNDDYQQMPPDVVVNRARRAAEWLEETVLRRALPVPNMAHLRRPADD
ncbi:MAG: sugar phosphate isomerase/epimerase [Burkholderiales bacterium]|nr:sugar phosphate isomerase/epimerase [Burkholderiales bacterium]